MKNKAAFALIVIVFASGLAAQTAESRPFSPKVDKVAETLKYLSSDEMLGRDTPSAELERAGDYIRDRFKAAGLKPLSDGSYAHTYTKKVVVYDSNRINLSVPGSDGPQTLIGNQDVRILRLPGAAEFTDADVLFAHWSEAAEKGLWSGRRTTIPVLLEVPETSPLWQRCAGQRQALVSGPGGGGAPMLLVREGVLKAGTNKATLSIPAPGEADVVLRNIAGIIPGDGSSEDYVVFSAHYDHIGVTMSGRSDVINNGADDNATGTTALIHLAELFGSRTTPLKRHILFVAFSGEERGLIGSQAFAANPPIPLKDIAVNINIEMLGRPEAGKRHQAWVTGRELSDFESIARIGFQRAAIELINFPMQAQLFSASDNFPLASAGVVAHSISAGSLHPDYHKPSDEFDKIDLEHMAVIIGGIYEAGVEFAGPGARPTYNEKGLKRLRRER